MCAFNAALHQSISLGRRRLIVLMNMDHPEALLKTTSEDSASTLRLYLRQYTHIDYRTADWFDRLLYALPVQGMLHNRNRQLTVNGYIDDDVPLLDA